MGDERYNSMRERLEHDRESAHQMIEELRENIRRHGEHVSRHPTGGVIVGYRPTAQQFRAAWPNDLFGDECIRDADALEALLAKP